MSFDDLKNPEFQEKLKNASSPEELLQLVKESGFELSDEQLEAVSGGEYVEAGLVLQRHRGLGRPELTPGCNACRRNAGTSCASCSRTPWRTWSI